MSGPHAGGADAPAEAGVDIDCWVEHYRTLEKPLYNVVYRWLWDASEAQDVVQEAFLRCWGRRDRIRADGFRALVYKTALNLAANRRRSKRLWKWVSFDTLFAAGDAEPAHPAESPSEAPADSAELAEMRAAVEALPEPLKRVLLLSEIAGMSYGEIATILGIKEGTVGSRRTRALAMLRHRLGARADP